MIPADYEEKVYASILAMNAGIRLGAPVEPTEWTTELIHDEFGEVNGYLKDYTIFSADDDANGPIIFFRALTDEPNIPFSVQSVAHAWLNYLREGHGMIWWGGDQISTEHTAYLNLKRGIPAPQSGSIEVNGAELAEQIGGQIFIDSFALLFPNNPEKAAEYAEIIASVSHDGDGINGARFVAACIASAFKEQPMHKIIEAGLAQIPEDSTYAKVVRAVVDFYEKQPLDFRLCRQYLEENWGYDRYGGICHIIPNAGVCVLALLYGGGSVSKTIEIATMCGWDTDCNAATVGSIVGALQGLSGIEPKYRKPMNDFIATSSVSGYLNQVDLPTFTKQVLLNGYRLNKIAPPPDLVESYREHETYFDFRFKGSTHGIRTSFPFKTYIKHNPDIGYRQPGCLEVFIDRMFRGESTHVYTRTFYRRKHFMDEKYAPVFSPTAYSGQKVSMCIMADQYQGAPFVVTPYVKTNYEHDPIYTDAPFELTNEWRKIEFTIPDTAGAIIEEVGFELHSESSLQKRGFGRVYVDEIRIHGVPKYTLDFRKQSIEFKSVTPFSHHLGKWRIKDHRMGMTSDTYTVSLTGHYYMEDTHLRTTFTPLEGNNHQLVFRSTGLQRFYSAGFENENEVAIVLKQNDTRKVLASIPYEWEHKKIYTLKVHAIGNQISLTINDEPLLCIEDDTYTHGMVGVMALNGGKCLYEAFAVNIQ